MKQYSCKVCEKAGKEFRVPADEIGAALMEAHLKDAHMVSFEVKK